MRSTKQKKDHRNRITRSRDNFFCLRIESESSPDRIAKIPIRSDPFGTLFLIVSCGLRHKPKTDHVTIRLTLHNLDFSQNHPVTPNAPGRSIFQYPPSSRKKTKNTRKKKEKKLKLKKGSHNHQEKTAVQWKNLA